MNILKRVSSETGVNEFDYVLDAIENEVAEETRQFVQPKQVMNYIRKTGDIPPFVQRHCHKMLSQHRQPALL